MPAPRSRSKCTCPRPSPRSMRASPCHSTHQGRRTARNIALDARGAAMAGDDGRHRARCEHVRRRAPRTVVAPSRRAALRWASRDSGLRGTLAAHSRAAAPPRPGSSTSDVGPVRAVDRGLRAQHRVGLGGVASESPQRLAPSGKARVQQRSDLVAQVVAIVDRRGIRFIVDPIELRVARVLDDRGTRDREERPVERDLRTGERAHQRASRQRPSAPCRAISCSSTVSAWSSR